MRLFRTKREFFAAIAKGDAATVQDYLKKSKDWLEKTGKHDASPAHIAAQHGQLEILRILLAADKKLAEARDYFSSLPLHTAAEHGKTDIVKELLEKHGQAKNINRPNYNHTTPLHECITHDKQDVLKIFLASGKADLTKNDPPALYHAVQQRKRDCVRILLAAGANPNTPHVVPVKKPFRFFFPDYGPEKNKMNSPLQRAIEMDQTQLALDLMEAGGRAEGDAEYPLHAAALNANIHLAHALLDGNHVDINRQNYENQTALHVAAERNVPEMVKFLLSRGAVTDRIDIDGHTPLDIARKYARSEIIDMIRDSKPPENKTAKPFNRNPPPPPVVQKPPATKAAANENEPRATWELNAQKDTLVHTHLLPDGQRRLTEIFNFTSRERVVISENLKTGAETMGAHESFDDISEEALATAWKAFKERGGKANEAEVFKHRIIKNPVPKKK